MMVRKKKPALPPAVIIRAAGLFIRAMKTATSEVKEAKDLSSEGGAKVTKLEALEIVEIVFATVMDDLADLIADS
jgi:hypothetical protein